MRTKTGIEKAILTVFCIIGVSYLIQFVFSFAVWLFSLLIDCIVWIFAFFIGTFIRFPISITVGSFAWMFFRFFRRGIDDNRSGQARGGSSSSDAAQPHRTHSSKERFEGFLSIVAPVDDLCTTRIAGESYSFRVCCRRWGKTVVTKVEDWHVSMEGPVSVIPTLSISSDNLLVIRCTATRSGGYLMSVTYLGKPMNGSPLTIEVEAAEIDARFCTVEGSHVGILPSLVVVHEQKHVIVQGRDKYGNAHTKGGQSDLMRTKFELKSSVFHDDAYKAGLVGTAVEDLQDGRYTIHSSFNCIGVFSTKAIYIGDVAIPNSKMEVVSVTMKQREEIMSKLGDKNAFFKGKMKKETGDEISVWIRLNQRQLAVLQKSFVFDHFGIFSTKLFVSKIQRGMPLVLNEHSISVKSCIDGMIELKPVKDDAVLLQGAMAHLLCSKAGNSGKTFEDRRAQLYAELKKLVTSDNRCVVEVNRGAEVAAALNVSDPGLWRRKWKISFKGEYGIDAGGLTREFFNILGNTLFKTEGNDALFRSIGIASRCMLHPKPLPGGDRSRLNKFKLAGMVLAKGVFDSAVFENHHLVAAHFSVSFRKMILNLPVTFDDFSSDDPELFESKVNFLMRNSVNGAGLDLTFSEEVYGEGGNLVGVVPLKPGGAAIPVTDSNKREYLSLLARFRLGLLPMPWKPQELCEEVIQFCNGFYSIIPEDLCVLLDENEMELLCCGLPEINLGQFRSSVRYSNTSDSDQVIVWFWECVNQMSQSERARLLQFITGSSQVPPRGFEAFEPRINIQINFEPTDHLPLAHTCFNTLELPRYRSFEQLQRCLLLAISEGYVGFGEM